MWRLSVRSADTSSICRCLQKKGHTLFELIWTLTGQCHDCRFLFFVLAFGCHDFVLCLNSMSLYLVLCLVFPCPHVSFKFSCVFSYVLPALFPSCSHVLLPFVTSPVGLPHLFLVLSSVSVYLVSVFPSLLVWSLFLSASFFVHAPIHVPAPVCSLFPMVCVFGFESCILPFDLNFAFWF